MTDLIESLLARLSLRTQVFHNGQHCGKWQLDLQHSEQVLLHFVSEGCCVVELPDPLSDIELSQGDLLLLLRPGKHVIRAQAKRQAASGQQFFATGKTLNTGASRLICAYVEFDSNLCNPLFEALPDVVVARADSHPDKNWLKHLLGLLSSEASSEGCGLNIMFYALCDLIPISHLNNLIPKLLPSIRSLN